MADFEQRDESGSLFINKRKESDRHPDRTGTAKVDGKMYRIAGWVKKTKAGDPWMSISFTPMEDEKPKAKTSSDPGYEDMDDDIPF